MVSLPMFAQKKQMSPAQDSSWKRDSLQRIEKQVFGTRPTKKPKMDCRDFGMAEAKPAISLPFTEGFENGATGWSSMDLDGDGRRWAMYRGASVVYSGTYSAVSESYDMGNHVALRPDNWLISPRLTLPEASNIVVSWYAKAVDPNYCAEHYEVYVSTSGADTGSFVHQVWSETMANDSWQTRVVDLSQFRGQQVYLAFRHFNCTDQMALAIDEISVRVDNMPGGRLIGPEMAFVGDTLHFVAQQTEGSATGLSYVWDVRHAAWSNAVGPNLSARWDAPCVDTVRVTMQNGFGTVTKELHVRIYSCDTVDVPFTEDFTYGLGCWNPVDANADGYTWRPMDSSAVSDSYIDGRALTPDNWLISQPIRLPADTVCDLRYRVRCQNGLYPAEHYSVWISLGGDSPSNFIYQVFRETLTEECREWQPRLMGLEAYAGQTIRLAFRHHNCSDEMNLKIDDVAVAPASSPMMTLACPEKVYAGEPAHFSARAYSADNNVSYQWVFAKRIDFGAAGSADTIVTVNSGEADYTWAEYLTNGTYHVRVTALTRFGTRTIDTTVTLVNCASVIHNYPHTHVFDVENDCWRGDGWVTGTSVFNDRPVAYSYSTDNGYNPLHHDNWLVSQRFFLNDTLEFSWSAAALSESHMGDYYDLLLFNSRGDTHVLFSETPDNSLLHQRKVSLASYVGDTVHFAFHHYGPAGNALCIADVAVNAYSAPDVHLVVPTSVRSGEDFTFRAHVASALPTTYSWVLQSASPSSSHDSVVVARWVDVPVGDYLVKLTVANRKGSTVDSCKVHVHECGSENFQFPYNDSYEYGMGCWNTIDADGDGYDWMPLSTLLEEQHAERPASYYARSGHDALVSLSFYPISGWYYYEYYASGSALNTDNYLVSPAIDVPPGTALKARLYMKSLHSEYPDGFAVKLATANPDRPESFNITLRSYERVEQSVYTPYMIDLSPYAGQTVYLAVEHKANDCYAILLDDFEIGSNLTGVPMVEVDDAVRVYPNPTTGLLNIEGDGIGEVRLMDVNGRTLLQREHSGTMDTSHLDKGIYFVRLQTAHGVTVRRVVKY